MGNIMICGIQQHRKKSFVAGVVVDEKFTRPRRLARQPSGVDYGRLRRLILAGKIAPCFDGVEEDTFSGELEECPICYLYYPSLNRSVCCGKRICTECFIQVKPSDITRSIRCPFCKNCFYAVEYCGARTEEEKGIEKAEEQKVIEAKLRLQMASENVNASYFDHSCSITEVDEEAPRLKSEDASTDSADLTSIECPTEASMQGSNRLDGYLIPSTYAMRSEEYNVGLEQIMLMEAMWESLQDVKVDMHKETAVLKNGINEENGTAAYNLRHTGSSFQQLTSESGCSSTYQTNGDVLPFENAEETCADSFDQFLANSSSSFSSSICSSDYERTQLGSCWIGFHEHI